MDRLACKRHASCNMLSCQENSCFVCQTKLPSKRHEIALYLCLWLYFATKNGFGFIDRLLCVSEKEILGIGGGGEGLPLYLIQAEGGPTPTTQKKKKKKTKEE